jgi:DNA polymerase-4
MVAKMVTKRVKPNGLGFLAPGAEADFMERLPAREVPGVGHVTGRLLQRLGIQTVRDLRRVPEPALRELLGPGARVLHQRAWGKDTRAVTRREIPGTIRRETSLEQPTIEEDVLVGVLHYLGERALLEVRRLGLAGRGVEVFVDYVDGPREHRRLALEAPSSAQEAIFECARGLLLPLLKRRAAVIRLGIQLSGFGWSPGEQQSLLPDANGRHPGESVELDRSVDRVRERFGFSSLVRGPSLELLDRLPRDAYGYVLRTPCLTK